MAQVKDGSPSMVGVDKVCWLLGLVPEQVDVSCGSKSLKFIKKLPDISGSVIIIKSIHYLSGETDRFTKAQGFDLHNMFKSDKNDPTKVDSIAGIKSGYLFDFLENASASKHLVGSYLKSYLS